MSYTPIDTNKEFIEFVLNELLGFFGLESYTDKNGKTIIVYYHNKNVTVANDTTFYRLLEFCGIKELADRYKFLSEEELFKEVTKCKYFNYSAFKTAGRRKSLLEDARTYGFGETFRKFIGFLMNNFEKLKDNGYVYTKHESMHVKAIDFFFNTDIEKTLRQEYNSLREALIGPEKVREYIQQVNDNNTVVESKMIKEVIQELEEEVKHMEGGMDRYLHETERRKIKEDIQAIFKYYVMSIRGKL